MRQLRTFYSRVTLALDFTGYTLIYIDECSVSTSILRHYCWAPKSEECTVFHLDKEASITVTAAVTKDRLVHMEVRQKSTTAEIFMEFLKDLKGTLEDVMEDVIPTSQNILIMDNARCHVSEQTQECLKGMEIRAMTLPPYTPQYNPCESFFLYLKQKLRVDLALLK